MPYNPSGNPVDALYTDKAEDTNTVHKNGDETISGVKTVPVGSANSWIFNQPPQVAQGTAANHPVRRDDSRLTDARTPTAHGHSGADITSGVISSLRLPPSLMGMLAVTTANTAQLTVDLASYPSNFGMDITLLHNSGLAPPTNAVSNRQVIEVAAFASGGGRTFAFDNAFRLGSGVSSRSYDLTNGQVLLAEIEYLSIVSSWVLKTARIVAGPLTTRVNLAQNPAYKTAGASPAWFGATGSARTTTTDGTTPLPAGMIRTTGFRYVGQSGESLGPNVGTGVTPSVSYVVSVQLQSATALNAVQIGINYLDSAGGFLSGARSAVQALAANTPTRLGFTSTAPANAGRMLMTIQGLTADTFATGVLYEQGSSIGTYFDGDTAGAVVNADGTITVTT